MVCIKAFFCRGFYYRVVCFTITYYNFENIFHGGKNKISILFTDMKAERNALHLWAHPQLQQFCQERGLEYQVVDMRWGVPDEAVDKHLTSDLCLHEIKVCQRLSAGPTFVVSTCTGTDSELSLRNHLRQEYPLKISQA